MSEFEEICEYYSSLFWGDLDSNTPLPPQEVEKRWRYVRSVESSVAHIYDTIFIYTPITDVSQLSNFDKDHIFQELADCQEEGFGIPIVYRFNNVVPQHIHEINMDRNEDDPIVNIHDITHGEDLSGCICAIRPRSVSRMRMEYETFQFWGRTECLYPFFRNSSEDDRKYFVQNITRILLKFWDGLKAGYAQYCRDTLHRAEVFYGTSDKTLLKNIQNEILSTKINLERLYRLSTEIKISLLKIKHHKEKIPNRNFANPLHLLYDEPLRGLVNLTELEFWDNTL